MRRCAARKTPRRAPAKAPTIDQELLDFAAVIAEHTLENNAHGWFHTPWRDGWNAVGLAYELAVPDTFRWLNDVLLHKQAEPQLYWQAEDRLIELAAQNQNTVMMERAALRCLQVLVANSSGGGHAYNAILISAFSLPAPAEVVDDVLEYRCRDSIGTTAVLQGDSNDRLRGAFRTAWTRGLYVAAYSLPQATVIGQMRVIK